MDWTASQHQWKEHLGPSYQLASMWAEGEEGQMTLDSWQQSNIKKQNQTIHHPHCEVDPILKDEEPETWLRSPVTAGSMGVAQLQTHRSSFTLFTPLPRAWVPPSPDDTRSTVWSHGLARTSAKWPHRSWRQPYSILSQISGSWLS